MIPNKKLSSYLIISYNVVSETFCDHEYQFEKLNHEALLKIKRELNKANQRLVNIIKIEN